jgi:hypothetical protein
MGAPITRPNPSSRASAAGVRRVRRKKKKRDIEQIAEEANRCTRFSFEEISRMSCVSQEFLFYLEMDYHKVKLHLIANRDDLPYG